MNKYLMTWYGITDFRASIGLEQTTGPVLGALLAEDYTDVVILGFTHPDKTANRKDGFQQKIENTDGSDPAAAREIIDLFSNSVEAHNHFTQWLEKQLRDAGKKVNVHFHPVGLKHLNDTEGIYEAATQSLNTVAASEGEKLVTLYLSPGTPVMAFVWAFAALRHPTLKKRLIASSQPGRPPERIALPNEWLEWHGRQVRTTDAEPDQYDAIFHLFGEQRVPNLLGVIQFSSRKHIFVNSAQFPADVMKQFLGEAEYGEIAVDPYDPENVRTTILDLIAKMPADAKIGFNLTGGTKLMYAGALAACRKVNATPFYFNSRNNQVVYLNDFKTVETKLIPSVETFIQLNGNNLFISKAGHWADIPDIESPDRKNLTNELWQARSKISRLYRELSRYNDSFQPFELHNGDIYAKLSKDKSAKISVGTKHFEFKDWPDFAQYLSGGWFEEYTFMKLQPLVDVGLIKDMRIGLEVSFKEDVADKSSSSFSAQLSSLFGDTYQELDITFTDGRRLYVIECKAGNVNSEHVMKLQNIVRYFGGIEGRAVLASCFYPKNKVVRKKIDDSKNLQLVSGNNLFRQLEEMIQPGGRHR
ncbi:hypothetical protein S7S_02565 [Isoalcanivorax pacificus W11-5]|uniref:Card1 endonuclease domain-containing protein n=1 Tax=Isoalcanivorax pacificus W11-5 TaxID=391936 RepID=A0A0B4XJT5_9GAMM|nr:DUF1887 family CARF protein [Isoalcanivorax pacificus]AJD46935.1 hypothetical protein S7S_02565 [Isoalcanivorax pacificus W11-5]